MALAPVALRSLDAVPVARPRVSRVAGPGPIRPLRRTRIDAALQPPAPDGVRPPSRGAEAVPPVGIALPRTPERGVTPGVEVTTGPLGQGFANAVGMAIAERMLAARFNQPDHEIVDHHTYVICSDGDLMEGVSAEAASLAGNLRLGKLVVLYDDNNVSIEGSTELAFCEQVGKRFEAYGWHVAHISDANDLEEVARAIEGAREERHSRSLLIVRSVIGYGAPTKAGTAAANGAPLGVDEARATKENLGWPLRRAVHGARTGLARCGGRRSTRGSRATGIGFSASRPTRRSTLSLPRRSVAPQPGGFARDGAGRCRRSSPRRSWLPGRRPEQC